MRLSVNCLKDGCSEDAHRLSLRLRLSDSGSALCVHAKQPQPQPANGMEGSEAHFDALDLSLRPPCSSFTVPARAASVVDWGISASSAATRHSPHQKSLAGVCGHSSTQQQPMPCPLGRCTSHANSQPVSENEGVGALPTSSGGCRDSLSEAMTFQSGDLAMVIRRLTASGDGIAKNASRSGNSTNPLIERTAAMPGLAMTETTNQAERGVKVEEETSNLKLGLHSDRHHDDHDGSAGCVKWSTGSPASDGWKMGVGRKESLTREGDCHGDNSSLLTAEAMMPHEQVEMMLQRATRTRQGARGAFSGLPEAWAEGLLRQEKAQQRQQEEYNHICLENQSPGIRFHLQQFQMPVNGVHQPNESPSPSPPLTASRSGDEPIGSRGDGRPNSSAQLLPSSRRRRRETSSPHGTGNNGMIGAAAAGDALPVAANDRAGISHLLVARGHEEVDAERIRVSEWGNPLASIADANERQRQRMMAWLTEMAASSAPNDMDASSVDALTDAILQVSVPPHSKPRIHVSLPAHPVHPGPIHHSMPSLPVGVSLTVSQAASLSASPQLTTGAMAPLPSSLSPPPSLSAIPRHLPLSQEALNSMGTAVRPLAMREVRALTLSLVQSIIDGSTEVIHALLSELEAASCPVGPAPQRTAYYFAAGLTSRVRGDALQRYFAEILSDPKPGGQAFMHYIKRVPFHHFMTSSCVTALSQALSLEYETAYGCWQQQPIERIHIIDTNIDFAVVWMSFLNQLAARPQGPPQSMRITLLDLVPPILVSLSESRRARAMQLKEQLSVQAVVVGIEEFECDVIVCSSSRMEEGLAQVKVNAAERAMRWRKDSTPAVCTGSSTQEDCADSPYAMKRMRRMRRKTGGLGKGQQVAGGRKRGRDMAADHSGRPVVDFLAVNSVLKLADLHPDASLMSPTPRDTYLKWVRSLHPNVFLLVEHDNDASDPFSVSRIGRVFDFNSNVISSHDISCSSQGPRTVRKQGIRLVGNTSCDAGAVSGGDHEPQATTFRHGTPPSHLRALEQPEGDTACFSELMDRQQMLVFERVLYMRHVYIILGSEGEQRYIRSWSRNNWAKALKSHGFVLSPIVPTTAQQMCSWSLGYPDHVQVISTTGGPALCLCNRDLLWASSWSV